MHLRMQFATNLSVATIATWKAVKPNYCHRYDMKSAISLAPTNNGIYLYDKYYFIFNIMVAHQLQNQHGIESNRGTVWLIGTKK